MQLIQASNKFLTKYVEAFKNKAPRFQMVYENLLKSSLTESISEWSRHSMCSYICSEKNATVHDLARRANSLTKLQHGSRSADARRHNSYTDSQCENTGRRGANANRITLTRRLRLNRLAIMHGPPGLDCTNFNADMEPAAMPPHSFYPPRPDGNVQCTSLRNLLGEQPTADTMPGHPASTPLDAHQRMRIQLFFYFHTAALVPF